MNFDRNTLYLKQPSEIRHIGRSLGLKMPNGENIDEAVARILQVPIPQVTPVTPTSENPKVNPAYNKRDYYNSPEEVTNACAPYAGRGVKLSFNDEDRTFHAIYRGREDCGTLCQPLDEIVKRIGMVAQGGFAPRMGEIDGEPVMLIQA